MSDVARITANFPIELQALAQWVVWKFEQRPGEKKPTKIPYNPATGTRADSTDPRTWAAFPDACNVYEGGGFDGLGFVVTEDDPYVGVDLDGCIVNGELTDDANRWLLALNSYAEISPSQRGVALG
jgi:primase-polymerase (primpol)-like protein